MGFGEVTGSVRKKWLCLLGHAGCQHTWMAALVRGDGRETGCGVQTNIYSSTQSHADASGWNLRLTIQELCEAAWWDWAGIMQTCCNLNGLLWIDLWCFPGVFGFAAGKSQVLKPLSQTSLGACSVGALGVSVPSPQCSKPCCLLAANQLEAVAFCQTLPVKHAAVLEFSMGWE